MLELWSPATLHYAGTGFVAATSCRRSLAEREGLARIREVLWTHAIRRAPSPVATLLTSNPGSRGFKPSLCFAHRATLFARRKVAEREGFEPSVELPPHVLSRDAQSTTLSSLQGRKDNNLLGSDAVVNAVLLRFCPRKKSHTKKRQGKKHAADLHQYAT
jgi:hypothetical protein